MLESSTMSSHLPNPPGLLGQRLSLWAEAIATQNEHLVLSFFKHFHLQQFMICQKITTVVELCQPWGLSASVCPPTRGQCRGRDWKTPLAHCCPVRHQDLKLHLCAVSAKGGGGEEYHPKEGIYNTGKPKKEAGYRSKNPLSWEMLLVQLLRWIKGSGDVSSPLPQSHSLTFLSLHFSSRRLRVRMRYGTCLRYRDLLLFAI